LFERGFEVFDHFLGQNVGIREVIGRQLLRACPE
jgi:hypothetical protein